MVVSDTMAIFKAMSDVSALLNCTKKGVRTSVTAGHALFSNGENRTDIQIWN